MRERQADGERGWEGERQRQRERESHTQREGERKLNLTYHLREQTLSYELALSASNGPLRQILRHLERRRERRRTAYSCVIGKRL